MSNFPNARTLTNDPQYFGTYLNMARHNVFLIANDLAQKFGYDPISDDEDVSKENFWLSNKIVNNPNHVYQTLIKRIPIAKVFSSDELPKTERKLEGFNQDSTDFKNLASFFKKALSELEGFRNDYSHFFTKTGNLESIKRKLIIDEELAIFLRVNFERAIEYTKKRFDGVFLEEDFEIARKYPLVDQDNLITEKGLVFFICLFLEKEFAIQFINRIKGFKNTSSRSFIATREVFMAFTITLPSEKFISDNPEQALQLDMLNYLSRCPDELFSVLTEEGKAKFRPNLGIEEFQNIINNSLIEENAEIPDIEEHVKNLSTQKRYSDRFDYFALRFLDNLESFKPSFQINLGKALIKTYPKEIAQQSFERNVINEIKVFGKLSDFKENLEISLENREKEVCQSVFNEEGVSFIQYAPHYSNENNKININIRGNEEIRKYHKTKIAEASLSINELPKIVLLEILKEGEASNIIEKFLKTNEENILNITFINEIKAKLNFSPLKRQVFSDKLEIYKYDDSFAKNIDQNIRKKDNEIKKLTREDKIRKEKLKKDSLCYAKYQIEIARRKNKVNDLLKLHKLNERQIPSRILDYWLNIIETTKELDFKTKIKAEKKECKDRSKVFPPGKGPKIGEMATFLAKDIVNMVVDLDVKTKITSFYYDKMQECLALYADPEKRELFIQIIKELNLNSKEKGHPFLANINSIEINRPKEFYNKYLTAKINWIETTFYRDKLIKNIGEINKIKIPLSFKKTIIQEKNTLIQWLANVKNGKKFPENANPKAKVIDLPTNLFDKELVKLLCEKVGVPDDGTYNFSKLLSKWTPDTQAFYNYERCYHVYEYPIVFDTKSQKPIKEYYKDHIAQIFNDLKIKREVDIRKSLQSGEKQKPDIQMKDLELVLKKSIEGNEKIIRHYQLKDRLTLLMFKKQFPADDIMVLTDFVPVAENIEMTQNSPLSKVQPLREVIPLKTQFDDEGKFIWEERKSERKSVTKTIVDPIRKLKDFGIFKKFINDKRLPELFFYYETDEIPLESLRKELFLYNKYQALILDKVFELEESIIRSASEKELNKIKKIGKHDNIQHKPYLEFVKNKHIINQKEYNFLLVVRNTFSHSQFPLKSLMDNTISWAKDKDFAEQIYFSYKKKVDAILNEIANG